MSAPLLQINDWQTLFEDTKSRKQRHRSSCIIPNKQGGAGYSYLVSRDNGEALYGAFDALILLLSKQPCDNRNGWLTVDGTQAGMRYDADYIGSKTLFKPGTVQTMLDEIVNNIGWATNHSKPQSLVQTGYPGKAPDKFFIDMTIEYHERMRKERGFDNRFNNMEDINAKGAVSLDLLHYSFDWSIDQIKALLAWMPTDSFWSRHGATLDNMHKINNGKMKAVSAMDAMGIGSHKGMYTTDQMLAYITKENLSTDDFVKVEIGGEDLWRKK